MEDKENRFNPNSDLSPSSYQDTHNMGSFTKSVMLDKVITKDKQVVVQLTTSILGHIILALVGFFVTIMCWMTFDIFSNTYLALPLSLLVFYSSYFGIYLAIKIASKFV